MIENQSEEDRESPSPMLKAELAERDIKDRLIKDKARLNDQLNTMLQNYKDLQ